jgi:oligopeptide transport system permease protein
MGRYVIRRLLQLIPVFFGTTFIIFAGVFMLPGDPIRALFGERPPPQALLDALTEKYNLNDPLLVQYGKYIGGIFLRGDFGVNFRNRAVLDIVMEAAPVTIKLGLTAFAIEVVIGITAGVLAGLRRGGFFDNVVLICTTLIISIPVFVLAFVSQLTVAGKQDWLGGVEFFPISFGQQTAWPKAYILPAIILASLSLAQLTRLTRTSLVENLRADYVRTAIAKGLSRRTVVGKHTLRNSLIPVVTLLGIDVGTLMGGAIVTEGIFNIPGMGRAIFRGIGAQENTVVVGISVILVIVFIMANLIVDLLYGVLDPRIRYD